MKLPTSIENILNENIEENARLELKKNWNPESILHSICAFANDIDNWGGGYILIGVEEENGRPKMPITGLQLSEIDKIQKDLLAKCKLIQPSYTPIVDVAQYKGKNILVVWCYGGQNRPYKCPTTLDKDFSKGYSYYIRKMSSTVKATETEQKELYDMARTVPFDDVMNHEAEIRDLKLPLIQNYLYEIKSDLLKESENMEFIDLCKSMRNETRDYFITTIFMHEGFENEIKEQPTTHQDTHQDKVLEFCKEPKTTKEIMAYLGLKDRRNFYIKYMRPLLDSGKLQMAIPDKPNTKNQKYITK